jgi:hypothetical protein
VKQQNDPVSEDESVYRRILNEKDHYNPLLSKPVAYAAFRPTDKDKDGISVYRPACGATVAQVASGRFERGYHVASLLVLDIVSLDIEGLRPTVTPLSDDGKIPGHAVIEQLNVTLRDGNKKQYRLLAQRLADLASANIVYRMGQ